MVSESIVTILQYGCLFSMTIVFSMIALERKTLVSTLMASLMWLVLGIANFIIGASIIGQAVSWLFGLVCFVFMGGFIDVMITSYIDYRKQRYDFGGY